MMIAATAMSAEITIPLDDTIPRADSTWSDAKALLR